ncbi:MAG: dihydropteroate synthase [Pseudobdellovibrionaceae bacterium]|jgi:dihydropteroate synthase|nr:dihydropteroate synthase [Pseudobdellovibrionaceae bacterium]
MIFIALGANLPSQHGTPKQTILKALDALRGRGVKVLAVSPIYLTAPVPISDQPWYHNAVALVKTHLLPKDLLKLMQDIEIDFGRIRTVKNAPRVLDLDVLDYQGKIIQEPELELPHPRMHERAFVLYPLRDVAPDWRHPVMREAIGSMILNLPEGQEIKNDSLPLIMGIVNVTPDSFSDGGQYANTNSAIRHGKQLIADGAYILDIGGESTRPGAAPVSIDEEIERVVPVLEGLKNCGAWLSVDTRHADVMRAAIEAGAHIVNDVSALEGDVLSLPVVANSRTHICLMHMKGDPRTMQDAPVYQDVVSEVYAYLEERVQACVIAGIPKDRIIVDVGIGFGKLTLHNTELFKNLSRFKSLGVRILLGASRKRFIPDLCGIDIAPLDRVGGSLASVMSAIEHGCDIVRVHDVKQTKQFIDVYQAIKNNI